MDTDFYVYNIELAEKGQQQIDWVSKWMPVVNRLYQRFLETGTFVHKRISICVHLEAKTAYLALILKALGANVWITSSNSLSTKDEVAAALAVNGIHVFARHDASEDEYWSYIHSIVHNRPHLVVDDGGDLCDYIHKNPEYGSELKGICEETTTGVRRLIELYEQNALRFPAIAVNDARSKYLFDNRYGTGQSTWTAITHLTNMNIAGMIVTVLGYGWVGRGIAMRAKGLGADVIITEIDPWKALEARMDGFRVMPLKDATRLSDMIITATGEKHVVTLDHFRLLKNGAFIANAGHFDYEIDVPVLSKYATGSKTVRADILEYALPENRKIYLLANGGIINIAGGLGHPVEIMDLSFAVQLGCLHHLLNADQMEIDVHQVPRYIDELVVREKLKADGIDIDEKRHESDI